MRHKMKYCRYCCNSSVEPGLSEENDLSYLQVGKCPPGFNMYIRSGDARPTSIVLSMWEEKSQRNIDIAHYDMKYCPECGRRLIENE